MRRIGIAAAVVVAIIAAVLWWTPVGRVFLPSWGCPVLAWIKPIDRLEILPTDYIEWNATAIGPSTHEPVHVRIYGDGRVERETVMTIGRYTRGCPLHAADKTLHIASSDSRRLLANARDSGFCRLCSSYQNQRAMDGGIEQVILNLHGKATIVWNHNGDPPPLLDDLTARIWQLSGIESVANRANFSETRKDECEKIEEARFRH